MNSMRFHNDATQVFGFAVLIHELQGRVASIAMLTEEFKFEARRKDLPWLDDRLARIHRTAAEMQRIINAVTRIEDDSPPERLPTDVSGVSTRLLRGHFERTPDFGRAKIRIQSNIQIIGDPDGIEIVLDNLIGNALKFSAFRDTPEVCITAAADSGRVVVHVSDNGVGIAPEDATRIFEPFTRCHSRFEGSGVGLAVARRIVERHGGRIWATGEPGLGSTISFSI